MNDKVESTIVFDGLIEGKLPDVDEIEEKLRQWVGFAANLGVQFNLDISGSSFSLLPETRPVSCKPLGAQPEDAIKQLLDRLLELLPEEQRQNIFSTLRSAEYQPGTEVQSIYAVGPLGRVQCETRTVDAKTTPPPTPISTRHRIRMTIYGLVIGLAVLGLTSLFVDLRGLFGQFAGTITPVKAEEIEIDLASFEEFFTIEEKKIDSRTRTLILTIKRTEAFPKTDIQLQAAFEKSGNSLNRRLAVEALARGYVLCELFDKDEKFYGSVNLRIRDLRTEETVKIAVPMQTGKKKHRLRRVEFTF